MRYLLCLLSVAILCYAGSAGRSAGIVTPLGQDYCNCASDENCKQYNPNSKCCYPSAGCQTWGSNGFVGVCEISSE